MVEDAFIPESEDALASSAQRVLIIGGLLAVAVGMLFGDIFAMFVLHPNNARIGQAMYEAALLIPAGDADGIMGRFAAIGGYLENRGTKIDAHSHMIHMGYLALLLAVLQPWMAFGARQKLQLAWLYIASTFLLPPSIFAIHYVGLAFSPLEHIGWASILADLFGFLLGVAVVLSLWGLWKYFRNTKTVLPTPAFLQGGDPASRTLLAGGLLLLVWGFLYGAAYAAWGVSGQATSEVAILKDIVGHAAAQQTALLDADFGAYGVYQMYRAINIATHTHINEMGILLLLLSFVQFFVYYSETWKKRWARVAVISAFGLPVGILLELKVGIVGSIVADLAGFGTIVALLAMLFGLLRYTGVKDSHSGGAA
ncbi:MAG: hypothetical protein RQ826_03605 [Xanthomonadales bacterium]|nr:hypothetical protein [Xanthomonadales bacterium]